MSQNHVAFINQLSLCICLGTTSKENGYFVSLYLFVFSCHFSLFCFPDLLCSYKSNGQVDAVLNILILDNQLQSYKT